MSLASCISEALEAGRISQSQFDQLSIQSDLPDEDIIKAALGDKLLQKRQKALEAITLDRAIKNVSSHDKGEAAGVMSLIVRDITGKANYANIDQMGRGIYGNYQRKLTDMLDAYRTKLAGLTRNKEGVRNFVRELFEESTGDDAARTFAKAWSQVSEEARINFNRAGGAIRKNKGWLLPQHHDPLMVHKAGFDKWYSDIIELIDPLTDSTGKVLNEARMREVLEESYHAIRTGGATKMTPGARGGAKLANRRQESRVFNFKDADSWLRYQDSYGSQDVLTLTQDWLRGISEDTAMMRVLGPNPSRAFEFMLDRLKVQETGPMRRSFLQAVFREQTGVGNVETLAKAAAVTGATRNIISSAFLGSAWLSAFPDTFFQILTSRQNGMSPFNVLRRMMKYFGKQAPGGEGLKDAYRTGIVAEAWLSRAMGANRYTEIYAKGVTAKASDFVMRASFLAPWSEAGRSAFSMEMMSAMATQLGKSFDEVDTPFRNALMRGGILPDEWNKITKIQPSKIDGLDILGSEALERLDIPVNEKNDIIAKYMGMVQQEADVAVPTPDARVRAITSLGTQKGTFIGEAMRTALMFKSFPVTLITTHLYRGAMMQGMDRISYLSAMFMGTTVLGALSLQTKDMSKGLEPRDMDSKEFWVAAAAQGGGLGIMGDFLFSDQNRFGGGISSSMSSPVFGMVDDLGKLTIGNIQQAIQGKKANVASESIDFIKNYLPGSSLWQIRLALERGIFEQAALMADPGMQKKYNRKIRKRKKDYKQDYWWKPGD